MGRKPKLSVDEMIDHMNKKGIKFTIDTEEAAKDYLCNNNNFFKLTSYRKNYEKQLTGDNAGKYLHLEFAYLKDLAIIDMCFRYILIQICLDIEHFSKVRLLKELEKSQEDGYTIIEEYRKSLSPDSQQYLESEINRNKDNPYCGGIYTKYHNDYPIWAFIEIIPFGQYIHFYEFFALKYGHKEMVDQAKWLKSVKDLRNATAHNNCIINDLHTGSSKYKTSYEISTSIGKAGISLTSNHKKMGNIRIQQIITLLYAHKCIVTSKGVKNHQAEVLSDFVKNRLQKNVEFYKCNDLVSSTFNFLKIIIDNWFPNEYTNSN